MHFPATVAIAHLTLRSLVRSRLVISVVAILILIVLGLPATIQSDGTLTGEIKIALVYCLGLSALLLGVVNLWASCGAIAQEIQGKQIRLVAVKPVHRIEIWLGKWLGLVFLNFCLLLFTVGGILTVLHWKLARSRASREEQRAVTEELLIGRRRIAPLADDLEQEIEQRFERLRSSGQLPPDLPPELVRAELRRRVMAEKAVVPPGRTTEWRFTMPRKIPRDAPVHLQVRLVSSAFLRNRLTGTWTVGTPSQPDAFRLEVRNQLIPVQRILLPAELVRTALSAADPRERVLLVRYTNRAEQKTAAAVFDTSRGVEVLVSESAFVPNLLRALTIIFCQLALVAALGLTVSAVFSFPVATFVVSAIILAACVSDFFAFAADAPKHTHHHAESVPEPSLVQRVGEKLIHVTRLAFKPLMHFDPLTRLSEGILVPWEMTARALILLLVILPGILSVLAGWVLQRRELALPT